MTVTATTRRSPVYAGNDSATTFDFDFKVYSDTDIQVRASISGIEYELVLNTHFSVTLNPDQDTSPGGTVTYPISGDPLATGDSLVIAGDLEYAQPTDLPEGGQFRASTIETALDRNVILMQQLQEQQSRALTLPLLAADASTVLPTPESRALIGWNTNANALENYSAETFATLVAYGTAESDTFEGDGFTTQFTLSENPVSINNLRVSVYGLVQTPGVDFTWTSGTTFTFTTAPPAPPVAGQKIVVQYMQGLPESSTQALRDDLLDTSDPAKGPALVALNPTLNYVAGTIGARLKTKLHVTDFPWLAKLDGVTDDAPAINACIAAAGNGGHVHIPGGDALCLSPILAENMRGLRITGDTGQYGFSGTRIIGKHTGKATLSLVGSFFCELTGISVEGETSARPKVGLLLGRSSAASAGNHTFTNVRVQGYFQTAGCYNVASEENTFINCYIVPNAAALAGLYMSQGDGFAVGGLTGASMECNTFIGGAIGNVDNTAGSTCIYLDCGAATGHHQFFGTFLTKHGGDSFITIRLGNTDGLDTEFPISFWNVVGEHGATQPTNGLHIISASTKILSGLTAKNLRLQTPSTNNILCDGGGQVYLVGADISTPYRAAGRKPSTFQRVDGSRLVLLSESAITIGQMLGSDLMHNTAGPTITTQDGCIVRDMSGGGFSLSEGLALATGGTVTINGLQVLGARATGYTAMTGAANRATAFDTGTVTLTQLAQRVKALQDDLATVHGLIGA